MAEFIRRVMINPRINIDRSVFPFTLPIFKNFDSLDFHPGVTFFVGDNGSGKSTLLEAVAVNFNLPAEGGTREHTFRTKDTHSSLHELILLAKGDHPKMALFLRAESFYNTISYLEDAGGMPRFGRLHARSHGEGFLDTVSGLEPHGMYLFDEPEAALSSTGQLIFLGHMKRLVNEGCQFIIATHSPIILGYGDALIYEFREGGMEEIGYRQSKPYQITLDFLRNRDRYQRELGLDPLE